MPIFYDEAHTKQPANFNLHAFMKKWKSEMQLWSEQYLQDNKITNLPDFSKFPSS